MSPHFRLIVAAFTALAVVLYVPIPAFAVVGAVVAGIVTFHVTKALLP